MVPSGNSLRKREEARRELGKEESDRRWSLRTAAMFAIGVSLVLWMMIGGLILLLS